MADPITVAGQPLAAATPANQGAPSAGNEPPKQGGNQDAAFRRLVEKDRARERELQSLRVELAELRGRSSVQSAPTPSAAPTTWEGMSDAQLDEAVKLGAEQTNYAAVNAATNEKIRRAMVKSAEIAQRDGLKSLEQQKLAESIRGRVMRDFGTEATNEDSPLYNLANRLYGQLIETYGREEVLAKPHYLYTAYAQANAELRAGQKDQLTETQRELDTLKKQMALERGGVIPGARRSPEVEDALKRGDIKGAWGATSFFKSMEAAGRQT